MPNTKQYYTKEGWKVRVIPNIIDLENSLIQLIRLHASIPNHELGDVGLRAIIESIAFASYNSCYQEVLKEVNALANEPGATIDIFKRDFKSIRGTPEFIKEKIAEHNEDTIKDLLAQRINNDSGDKICAACGMEFTDTSVRRQYEKGWFHAHCLEDVKAREQQERDREQQTPS